MLVFSAIVFKKLIIFVEKRVMKIMGIFLGIMDWWHKYDLFDYFNLDFIEDCVKNSITKIHKRNNKIIRK